MKCGASTKFYALDQLSTFKYTYTVCTCKVYYLLKNILNENVHFFADSVLAYNPPKKLTSKFYYNYQNLGVSF